MDSSPVIMAPQRGGGTPNPLLYLIFFTIVFYDVSKKTYIDFGGLGSTQFFGGHWKVGRVSNLY